MVIKLKNKIKSLLLIFILLVALSSCRLPSISIINKNNDCVSFDTINSLEETAALGHVRITLSKNTPLGGDITMGSGTIVYEDLEYYYLLTNNHVVYYEGDTRSLLYKVTDAYMNTYYAKLIKTSVDYDLAYLRIAKGDTKLHVFEFESEVNMNDICIAIGDPKGQSRVYTIGRISELSPFNPIEDEESLKRSNVKFDVYTHSAKINNGSSGGALLNEKLKLIGINFASAIGSQSEEFIKGYAIPIAKAIEFINKK